MREDSKKLLSPKGAIDCFEHNSTSINMLLLAAIELH